MPRTKQAVVLGGTGGIGRAIGAALEADGFAVLLTGVTDVEVDDARQGLRGSERLEFRRIDVTDHDSLRILSGQYEKLDALIACFGIALPNGRELEHDGFRSVVEVNLNGAFRACQLFRSALARVQGSVVTFASMLSTFGSAAVPAYSASKGGLVQLTRSLAIAYADSGIRVNAVAPGWIETDLNRSVRSDPDRHNAILSRTPLKRWGTPQDVAGPVAFLCSEKARFITGTVLTVDGGYSCT